jgi:hypothetical protein
MAGPAFRRREPLIIEISSDDDSDGDVVLLAAPPAGYSKVPRRNQGVSNSDLESQIQGPSVQLNQPSIMREPAVAAPNHGLPPTSSNDHTNWSIGGMDPNPTDRSPTIDLTSPFYSMPTSSNGAAPPTWPTRIAVVEEVFAAKILDIFPDISRDYIKQLFNEAAVDGTCSDDWCNQITHRLLDEDSYPKERDRRQELKRKRDMESNETGFERFEAINRTLPNTLYAIQA